MAAGRFRSLVLIALTAVGCASYGSRMDPVLRALVAEDYGRAVAQLEKHPDPESVLWQVERGALLRCAKRWPESNQAFALALSRQEDLYTHSVSNEAAALAVSDALRPYRAADFETPFLHLYPALNYLDLGDLEGALVEARALSQMLELRRAEKGDPGADWGPGRLLAAMIFEAAGEWNDAWIAYRAAETAFQASEAGPGEEVLSVLRRGIARTAYRMGMDPGEPLGPPDDPEAAHIVVWIEEGIVPLKKDLHLRVPILKEEEDWGEDRVETWSERVGARSLSVRSGHPTLDGGDVAYFLDVALPVLPEPVFREPFHAVLRLPGGATSEAVLLQDLEPVARADLERNYPTIAARAATRAILKALATRTVRKKSGPVAGTLTNILGAATERADTRSWSSLPARIGLAVLDLPSGRSELWLEHPCLVPGSAVRDTLDLPRAGWRFITRRFFP